MKRSPSLHSEQSSLSDSKHVSFNQDVSVKRIPKKTIKATRSVPLNPADEFSGRCESFTNRPPPSDKAQIAEEAEDILKQLQDIECSVSSNPKDRTRVVSPTRILTPSRVLSLPPPHVILYLLLILVSRCSLGFCDYCILSPLWKPCVISSCKFDGLFPGV